MKKAVSVLVLLTLVVAVGALGYAALSGQKQNPLPPPVQQPVQTPDKPMDTVATLCVAGDIVLHTPLSFDAYDSASGGYDYSRLFRGSAPHFEAADYAVACLETTFNGAPYTGYPQFCSPDAVARDLRGAGLDLLSTASNHAMDTNFEGLVRTLDVLDENGLAHVGTYRSQAERDETSGVFVADVGGISVAFLAFTYSTNGMPIGEVPYAVNVFTEDYMGQAQQVDYERIRADMAAARALDTDAIAVFMHWGQEYRRTASEQQQQLADFLFEQGATLVLGGHVHVPQPMETRTLADGNTGFLCYCLGNFVSNQQDRYTNLTALVNLELTKDGESGEVTVSACDYVPMYMLHANASNAGRYELLDTRQAMSAYEAGDTAVVSQTVYERLQTGLDDLHGILGASETLQ